MVAITIKGRVLQLPSPALNFGGMRQAAPFIDSINSKGGAFVMSEDLAALPADFMQQTMAIMGDLVAVVSIAAMRADHQMTVAWFEEHLGFEDMPELRMAFREILKDSGLGAGEAAAPAVGAPEPKLSQSSSIDSSGN